MTIDQLIEELEAARDDLGGNAEVRIAYQENWPLRGAVAAVTLPSEAPYDEDEDAPGQDADDKMAWIAVGSAPYDENPYAPRWAWTQ
jgi:hypothetical protein